MNFIIDVSKYKLPQMEIHVRVLTCVRHAVSRMALKSNTKTFISEQEQKQSHLTNDLIKKFQSTPYSNETRNLAIFIDITIYYRIINPSEIRQNASISIFSCQTNFKAYI